MRTRATQRIDKLAAIRPMSCNVEGHEDRMKAHCERVQQEYFDNGKYREDKERTVRVQKAG